MNQVLVVDDSPIDRQVVGRILEAHGKFQVEYAANGREAITHMESLLPAVVITDLCMPEMDGMELVTAVRRQFGSVPVIVITAKGSEETALSALAAGAADYVPKSKLNSRLLDSLNGVLAMAASNRVEDRLLRSLAYQEMRYELINDVSVIAPLADQVRRVGTELGLIDETDGVRLARAVTEALRNAMYHGNLELPLGEFEDGDQLPPGDADVIAMLHSEGPYDGRRIHFRAAFNREEARITIRDEGPGFNPAAVADAAADPAQLSGGGGHGLLLIRMFVDEVTFNEVGNEITLIKRRRCSPPAAQ